MADAPEIRKNHKKPSKARLRGFGGLQKICDRAAAGGLTFRELEALTSTGLASFLTLARAGVTLHVAFLLERHTEIRVELLKSAGDAEANRTCLAVEAAALCFDSDVDLVGHLDSLKRGERRIGELFGLEVGTRLTAIDDDFATSTGEADAGGGCLTTADGYKCFFAHYLKGWV
jgi:hypothetical protein